MHILIIEDEPAIADTVRYALQTEGLQVTWVSTGSEGLVKLSQQAIDLVLLDIGLPDISGFDVCRQIREHSEVPIIFLTARTDDIDQVLGLELGADDYVTKPFSPRVLTARVRSRLRTHQPGNPLPENDLGNAPVNTSENGFHNDSEGLRILLNGQDLQLSRYEYRILLTLLEHPGRVYSRAQLMDLAWEEPERSFDRTVDTHIKTLRQKIRAVSPETEAIRTHRGLGYSYQP